MKFFGTIVAAIALLPCGISAVPLGDLGGIHPRAPPDYKINNVLEKWMADGRTQKRLENHCNTKGGWEGWAQGELGSEFRGAFEILQTIREDANGEKQGHVIELKCENAYGQKGVKIKAPVRADTAKQRAVKPEFNDYTFVALVIAFTTEADLSLRKIGMKPIPGAVVDLEGPHTVRIYREDYKLKSLIDEIEDLDEAMYNLFLSKSRPGSPSGTPPSPSNPAPGKTAPGKTAPGKTAPGKTAPK